LLSGGLADAVPGRAPKLRFIDVLRPLSTLLGTVRVELLLAGVFSEAEADRVEVVARLVLELVPKLRFSDVLRLLLALRDNDAELDTPEPERPNPLVVERPSVLWVAVLRLAVPLSDREDKPRANDAPANPRPKLPIPNPWPLVEAGIERAMRLIATVKPIKRRPKKLGWNIENVSSGKWTCRLRYRNRSLLETDRVQTSDTKTALQSD
jgi:hypothetical protein